MLTTQGNMHLEIQTSSKNPVGIIRSSYYEEGKVRHKQYGRLPGCTLEQLKMLQLAFREQVAPKGSASSFNILQSKEYGASFVAHQLVKEIGLDKIIFSKSEPWVNCIIANIIGRLVHAGRPIPISSIGNNSSLWEICGITEEIDVKQHCYLPVEQLLTRQKTIQKKLTAKHVTNNELIIYDITFNYKYIVDDLSNNQKQNDSAPQPVIIGLICNNKGCPLGIEIFNSDHDNSTIYGIISKIQDLYETKKVSFISDGKLYQQKTTTSATNAPANVVSTNMPQDLAQYLKVITEAFLLLETVPAEIIGDTLSLLKASIFLCMLTYYLQFHMVQKLDSFIKQKTYKNPGYAIESIIESLKTITYNNISADTLNYWQISVPSTEQKEILQLMNIILPS